MRNSRFILSAFVIIWVLAAYCPAIGSPPPKKRESPADKQGVNAMTPQDIFKRDSPSVLIVKTLDVKGAVIALGSGVVIAPGRIITNRHVISDGVSFEMEQQGKTWSATVLRVDPDHDLAELTAAGFNAPAVRFRPSSTLSVGEKVYAIGAPEGLELTISEGLISGLRDIDQEHLIQTSAAISPGSSGGGLFDAEGRLVGITTFYLKEGQNLNFALPSEWATQLDHTPVQVKPALSQSSPYFQGIVWIEAGIKADIAGKRDEAIRDWQTAVSSEKEAVRLKPEDESAWSELGFAYDLLDKYDKAVSAEQEALRLKPDDETAWFVLGFAYDSLDQYDKAVSAEKEAIRLKPDDESAWYELGFAYFRHGRKSKVIEVYKRLKALDPVEAEKFFRKYVLP